MFKNDSAFKSTAFLLGVLLLAVHPNIGHAFVPWATSVHELMIDLAFPSESFLCLARMKQGSREVDGHQGSSEAYMHAMRSSPDQSDAQASTLSWDFIDQHFVNARIFARASEAQSCLERGMALHPVMDATSPAHRGNQVWQPFKNPLELFRHGDWVSRLNRFLPIPIPSSEEDFIYLDDHPWLLTQTAELIRIVDEVEMSLPVEEPLP
ncbi:hypothetical protein WDW37_10855 [Bdellovibrionota bacterium FG-1]